MGLGEILGLGANVILKLKADTTQARAALKELSGEEKKAAEAAIKLTEAENKRLEAKAKRYQFVGQAIGGVTAAVSIGKQGLEAYAKTSTSAAAEVKKIQDTASKAFDGVMASIGKTVVSLGPLIGGLSRIVNLLNDAGVAGPAAMGALALAVTGNPIVAGLVGVTTYGINNAGKGAASGIRNMFLNAQAGRINTDPFGSSAPAQRNDVTAGARQIWDAYNRYDTAGRTNVNSLGSGLGMLTTALGDAVEQGLRRVGIDQWNPFEVKKAGERNILDPDGLGTYGSRYRLGAGSGTTGQRAEQNATGIDRLMARQRRAFDAGSAGLMNPYAAQGSGIRGAQESQLAQVFGPLSDFNAYATAFDTLSGAVGSALGAWIDGSMSAGKAFKAFIGEAVKGIAIQMAMEALKHGAFAIGSLAFGNVAGAAMHGQAAAQFGAGALAASIAAKSLHGGSGGASAGGSRTAAPAPNYSTAQPYNQTAAPVIVVGSPFAYDSPRNQQRNAKRLVAMSQGTSAVVYG